MLQVVAVGGSLSDALDVSVDDLLVALEREDQGDVDGDALGQGCSDCRQASRVAGILIMAFGRLTFSQSSTACCSVASVSWARRGSTSMETRPSTKSVASAISRKMSVALRTSVVVSSRIAVSTSTLPSSLSCASYGPTWLRAFWKMDGLVVTQRRSCP